MRRSTLARAVPALVTAGLVAALVLGAGSLRALSGVDDAVQQPSAQGSTATSDPVIDLDLGPVGSDEVADCITPDFSDDPSTVDVLYGVQQRHLAGSNPVLVLRNVSGDLRLCDAFGGDSPATAPVPSATAGRPVAFLSTGRSSWQCAGTTQVLDRFERSMWLSVSPAVATVQQRYWIDGRPGRWFRTSAYDGYVHLQSWIDGPRPASTKYAEQFRVLDGSGADVRQTALPTRQSRLPGCSSGGSAEIG